MKVFVYGTLLKGLQRANVLANSKCLGPAILNGAALYDLGSYPGLVHGNGEVAGELYEIDDVTLAVLDGIEGFMKTSPASSLYIRQEVSPRLFSNGSLCRAFAYIYNGLINEHARVKELDYRVYRMSLANKIQPVAAYGSNLDSTRFTERVGYVEKRLSGSLVGFKLVFNKKADNGLGVYANICHSEAENCPVEISFLNPGQLSVLDRYEGIAGGHYARLCLIYNSNKGNTGLVQCYLAHPERLCFDLKPKANYIQHIQAGYKEKGFGELVISNT